MKFIENGFDLSKPLCYSFYMPYSKPEERRRYAREYYARNREKIRKQVKEARGTGDRLVLDPEERKRRRYEYNKKWKEKNPVKARDHQRRSQLKRRYGITPEDVDALMEAQGGVCAICKTDDPGGRGVFVIDHCHDTGKVRGLLCNLCNKGLGCLGDTVDKLEAATDYLRRTS